MHEPIAPAFVAAAAIHALVLLTFGFAFEWPEIKTNTLAVTVALTPAAQAPDNAQHVAAENQLGTETPGEQAPQMRMQTQMTISRELDGADGEVTADQLTPEALERQLQELEQQLSSLSDSSAAANPRIGSVAARRSLDAEYLSRWRARVEQVGNALYRGEPPAGNGDVRLLVSVTADGALERIRVIQSSGNPDLDRAAQDTVVIAAPFPKFSSALAAQTRRLEIVRTWQFRTQTLSSGQ
ncbi:MAG: hypothetical protein RLZZ602_572 [Pseudomonadota bacterium]